MLHIFKWALARFLAWLCIAGLAFTIAVLRPASSHPAQAAVPQSAGAHVYFASNDSYIYSLNASTGALAWRYHIGVAVVWPLAVNNGIVYVPANTTIDAFNASNGSLLWGYKTGGTAFAPAVNSGIAYFNSNDGHLYAVNATTGVLLWTAPASSPYYSTSFKPTIVNGVVYDSADGDLFAFNASSGALIWHDFGSGFGGANTALAFSNNVLYFGSHNSCLVSANALNGSVGFQICTGYGVQARPIVANGLVYFCPSGPAGRSGNVEAVSVKTNQIVWSYPTTQGPSDAQAAVDGGVVYVGAGKSVYALNATAGVKIWARFLATSIGAAGTTVANGLVYVGGANGQVYALKEQSSNGSMVWTYMTGGAINVIPVVG